MLQKIFFSVPGLFKQDGVRALNTAVQPAVDASWLNPDLFGHGTENIKGLCFPVNREKHSDGGMDLFHNFSKSPG
jgi:hypothetical protein